MDEEFTQVLIAKDDFISAANAADAAELMGYEPCMVKSLDDAIEIIETKKIDLAVLDYQLMDGTIEPVATLLHRMDTPHAVVSESTENSILKNSVSNAQIYTKPVDYSTILADLQTTSLLTEPL